MSKALLLCAALSSGVAVPAQAQQNTWVGNWFVQTDRDRFTDNPIYIAVTWRNGDADTWLAVRCIDQQLDLAVRDPVMIRGLTPNSTYVVLFRADTNRIVTTFGVGNAIKEHVIEIIVKPEMRRQLLTAREYAFRFNGIDQPELQFDEVFDAGTARDALVTLFLACPVHAERKE